MLQTIIFYTLHIIKHSKQTLKLKTQWKVLIQVLVALVPLALSL